MCYYRFKSIFYETTMVKRNKIYLGIQSYMHNFYPTGKEHFLTLERRQGSKRPNRIFKNLSLVHILLYSTEIY